MSKAAVLAGILDGAESLAIVCHDDPDPDCLASALALEAIADARGVEEVTILYGGEISHQQNRAFVKDLAIDAVRGDEFSIEAVDCVAFVDHSRRGGNSTVPRSVEPDVVVDHHPGETVPATFTDVRVDYGATATIFVEYLMELDIELTTRLASALLFALHRERLDFVREPTRREYEAALAVYPDADLPTLERLYGSAFTPETIDAIAHAITTRERQGAALVASAGRTTESDALPQAADYLLNLEGIDTDLVYGIVDEYVRLSARTIDPNVHVGRALVEAYADLGSVGGHHDMAGGRIPLDVLTEGRSDYGFDTPQNTIARALKPRFFDAISHAGDGDTKGEWGSPE